MRPLQTLAVLLAVLLAAPLAAAQDAAPPADAAGVSVPLLDRDLFFGDPEVSGARLSPDGRFLAFMRPYRGVRNVWVKGVDEPFDAARPMTADDRPVSGASWSRDGAYLVYGQDKGGDENVHIYVVDPTAPPEAATGVPPSRDVTPYDGVKAQLVAAPKAEPRTFVVGLNDRDPQVHDLYRVDLDTGERELVVENPGGVLGWTFDRDDRLRLAVRMTPEGRIETVAVGDDGALGDVVLSCTVHESCGSVAFTPGGDRFYAITNAGDRDLTELVTVDPATGDVALVEADPEGEADLQNVLLDDDTGEIVATVYEGDRRRLYWRDAGAEADYAYVRERLEAEGFGEAADVYRTGATDDDRTWLVYAQSDTDPGAMYLFDRDARELALQYRPRPGLSPDVLAPRRPVRYASTDGTEIPGYLTVPRGERPEAGWPLVVYPHGGPWARDSYGYDGMAQFLANRGYAVLQPNFRASTGYGKAFQNAGNREWGRLMQDDLTAGVDHLVDQGLVDPSRVGIYGVSYGGYAALAGLAFTPEAYAAGVSYVGPSNLFTLLESLPSYWEPLRARMYEQVGDPTTPEGEALLRAASPLFSADRIEDPLLVIQGANDPRVKQAESDQIVVALRDRGAPVGYLVAEDEGHGFAGVENRTAAYAALEAFLAEHLGGRVQAEMPEAVAARLAEITVDPATVVLEDAGELEAARVADLPALDGAALAEGASSYAATIEVQGQTVPLSTTREVRREGDSVVVTERASTPMGEATDVLTLDGATLRPVSRRIEQGPAVIELAYGDGAVTGTVAQGEAETPVDVALDAPVLGDAATLGAAGLAVGDEAAFRTFDAASQRVAAYRAVAEAAETVEVPAGSFETVRVALEPVDGASGREVLWFDGAGRLVKRTAVLPQMGGAVMTVELAGDGPAGG